MLHRKFNKHLATLFFMEKKKIHVKEKACYVLNYLKFKKQCTKTIHERLHRNKIKKMC